MDRIRSFVYGQSGQTTAEYALVLLVAGIIVGVFAAFVKSGAMTDFFSTIVGGLVERAEAGWSSEGAGGPARTDRRRWSLRSACRSSRCS